MKKKILIITCILAALAAGVVIWWKLPVHFLAGEEPAQIASIEVFDGNTGKGFTVEDSAEIASIVENIQGCAMTRDRISLGYSGYRFRMTFVDKNGREIDSFIVNAAGSIRKDPFFYRSAAEGLCYDYLQELAETASLAGRSLPESEGTVVAETMEQPAGESERAEVDGGSGEPENLPGGTGSTIQIASAADYPAMIRVDGALYYDSGEISKDLRCGMMDGKITSVAAGEPTEDDQSNFGVDYGYQYWTDGEIHVYIDEAWHIFIPHDAPREVDWDSLSEQERMELDPAYGVNGS